MFFYVIKRYLLFANFQKKILIFKVPVIKKNENFVAHAAKFADLFGIGLIKIYLTGSIVPVFENCKMSHITPP